jgi:molecular chaperone Hsp33
MSGEQPRASAAAGRARPASGALPDDLVLPYRTVRSDVIGRLARLGRVVDTILSKHDYPEPVSRVLGEALVLTTMLGAALKPGSRLILQTKAEGPIGFLVADYDAPGRLRGYASFDAGAVAALVAAGEARAGRLLGSGHLAMTIDPGGGARDRYQAIVPLEGQGLTAAAHAYFRQSEQLPTFVRLAVARHFVSDRGEGQGSGWSWRAGGLLAQLLPREGGPRPPSSPETDNDDERLLGEDDDHWQRVRILAATVEDHELLDPTLAPERLLYRLFHEEGVRVFETTPIVAYCRCSRERVTTFLDGVPPGELDGMRDSDGAVSVTCEFCNARYRFEPGVGPAPGKA